MRRTFVAVVVCCAACSGSSRSVPSTSAAVVATAMTASLPKLPCSENQHAVPDNFTVFFDAVALPATPMYPTALQTSAQRDDAATRLWAKTGLWYRADRAFEIVVPDALIGQVAVGWGGSPSSPGPGVANTGCPGAQHDWVVVAGGYWASRTMCATLVIRADSNEQHAPIGLGAPCPGQAPPAGPSDK